MAIETDSTASTEQDIALLEEGDTPTEEAVEQAEPTKEPTEETVEETAEETPAETSHPFDRPSVQQIQEKYPDIFKTFPSLRDMYFREREYTKLFPTVDDAREAVENNDAFLNIKDDIFSGDGSKFFNAVKEVDGDRLLKFSAGLLPTLVNVDPKAFWAAANPLVEDIARNMYSRGEQLKDDDLKNAALNLSKFFFGSTDIAEGKRTFTQEKDSEVSKERETFENERQSEFLTRVSNECRLELTKLIDNDKLDPKGVLSPFIRKTIIDRVISDIGDQLQADRDHLKFMDSLWNHAKRNGRTEQDKSRIVSAYRTRAQSLIPSLRSKYVSEALGTKVRSSEINKGKLESIRVNPGTSGAPSKVGSKGYNPKSINYSKTSDEDILNDEITYK